MEDSTQESLDENAQRQEVKVVMVWREGCRGVRQGEGGNMEFAAQN